MQIKTPEANNKNHGINTEKGNRGVTDKPRTITNSAINSNKNITELII